jgi:hypothetical protein
VSRGELAPSQLKAVASGNIGDGGIRRTPALSVKPIAFMARGWHMSISPRSQPTYT